MTTTVKIFDYYNAAAAATAVAAVGCSVSNNLKRKSTYGIAFILNQQTK